MKTPAQRHFERVTAQQTAATAAPGQSLAGASRYDLMLAKLATDRRRLKDIQSIERKIEVKRELLPDYADYVTGSLEGGKGAQDDVLVTVMMWRIDAGDYDGAIEIAEYVLTHGLKLPDQFERTAACAIAEEFAEAALRAIDDGTEFSPLRLATVGAMTEKADMPDQVRAKLLKAYAKALLFKAGDPNGADRPKYESALEAMRRAIKYFDRVGCKKDIAALEKALAGNAAGDAAGGK